MVARYQTSGPNVRGRHRKHPRCMMCWAGFFAGSDYVHQVRNGSTGGNGKADTVVEVRRVSQYAARVRYRGETDILALEIMVCHGIYQHLFDVRVYLDSIEAFENKLENVTRKAVGKSPFSIQYYDSEGSLVRVVTKESLS